MHYSEFHSSLFTVNADNRIYKDGVVFAGSGIKEYSGDGESALNAGLSPNNIVSDELGNLFISELGRIRKVDKNGIITTFAGNGDYSSALFTEDGSQAERIGPTFAIGIDTDGSILFSGKTPSGQAAIRKIKNDGTLETIIGGGFAIFEDGLDNGFSYIRDIAVSKSGTIAIVGRERVFLARKLNKLLDSDNDFVANFLDNCISVKNLDQKNTDKENELLTKITGDAFGDVCDTDDDNDGLLDTEEITLKTNPLLADTDGDGLNDQQEVNIYLTDPLVNADKDNDGLSDAVEILTHKTNHKKADTDSDGMPDAWEIANKLNPINASDASQDADADGFWNLAEYLEGSSPQNDQSIPDSLYANVISLAANNSFELLVDGIPVAMTKNGIQAVPNIPTNQGAYRVSISAQPANQICTLSNHLNINDNTEAVTAIDITCGARKLGMEYFGFAYPKKDSSEPAEAKVPSIINFVVKVRDENTNNAVLGLTSTDFQVKENGTLISPSESFLESRPIGKLPYTYKLGILLDISRSLLLSDVDLAKQAALKVVNAAAGPNGQLQDSTEISVWTFDGIVNQIQDYTTNVSDLTTAITAITRGGSSTNLNEALYEGLSSWTDSYELSNLNFGSLIVITDGADTSGLVTTQTVVSARGDKAVYAIAVGPEASNTQNAQILKTITGEKTNPTSEQQRVFTSANFEDLSAQLEIVVKQAERFFEGLYAIYYTSPKCANTQEAELSITQNTSCVLINDLVCKITEEFNADDFGEVNPELFSNWPSQFLSTNTLELQIETLWSGDPANYRWVVVSADSGMSLTVDSNDSSLITIAADTTADDTAITFEVFDDNYPTIPGIRHTVYATDGVLASIDVCPSVFDPKQEDADGDKVGDACLATNTAALLDIDGSSGPVNTFDILLVQRYQGGVSNISSNIQLPTGVGGSGTSGAMTNTELSSRIAQMLASVSLDVDGDTDTDTFDLLIIQRYIGGVSNLATNIKLVEGVGGSGANGARTNAELRAAVAKVVGF
jgi:uncharacterized protein YegL